MIRRPAHAGAYGHAALRAEISWLSNLPPGSRNHALNRAAFNLFQLVAGGELDRSRGDRRARASLRRERPRQGRRLGKRARHHHSQAAAPECGIRDREVRDDRGAASIPGRGDRRILARGRGGTAPHPAGRADRGGQNRDRPRHRRTGAQPKLRLAVSRPPPRNPDPDQQQAARNPARHHPARRPAATARAGAGRQRADAASSRHQGRHDGIARGQARHRRRGPPLSGAYLSRRSSTPIPTRSCSASPPRHAVAMAAASAASSRP